MNRVKEYRLKTGESQSRFARRIDMNVSLLCDIENGRRTSKITARKIAAGLGVAPEAVFPDFSELTEGRAA